MKKEKINAAIIADPLSKKNSKKIYIILGSAFALVGVTVAMGVGFGLKNSNDGHLPMMVVNAKAWKRRADNIIRKHDNSKYSLPRKVSYTLEKEYRNELDSSSDLNIYGSFSLDMDELYYYGRTIVTSADKARESTIWYSYQEDTNCFSLMALERFDVGASEKGSQSYSPNDEDLAAIKSGDSDCFMKLLDSNLRDFLTSQNGKLGDIAEAIMPIYLSDLVNYVPATDWYDDNYQNAIGDGGQCSNADSLDDAKCKDVYNTKTLKLTSSGRGSIGLNYEGEVDGIDESENKYTKSIYYKLGYNDYNMNYHENRQVTITKNDAQWFACLERTEIIVEYGNSRN